MRSKEKTNEETSHHQHANSSRRDRLFISFELNHERQINLNVPSFLANEVKKMNATHMAFGYIKGLHFVLIHLNHNEIGMRVTPETASLRATNFFTILKQEIPALDINTAYRGIQLNNETFLFSLRSTQNITDIFNPITYEQNIKWVDFDNLTTTEQAYVKWSTSTTNEPSIHLSTQFQDMLDAHHKNYLAIGYDEVSHSLILRASNEEIGIPLTSKNNNKRRLKYPFTQFFDEIKNKIGPLELDRKYFVKTYLYDTFIIPLNDRLSEDVDYISLDENQIEWIDRLEETNNNKLRDINNIKAWEDALNKLKQKPRLQGEAACFYTYQTPSAKKEAYALYIDEWLIKKQIGLGMTHVIFGFDGQNELVYLKFNNKEEGFPLKTEVWDRPYLATSYWKKLSSIADGIEANKFYSLMKADSSTYFFTSNEKKKKKREINAGPLPSVDTKWVHFKEYSYGRSTYIVQKKPQIETIRIQQKLHKGKNKTWDGYHLTFSRSLAKALNKTGMPYMKCGTTKDKSILVFELTNDLSVIDMHHVLYPKQDLTKYYYSAISKIYPSLVTLLPWLKIGEHFEVIRSGNRVCVRNPEDQSTLSLLDNTAIEQMEDINWIELDDLVEKEKNEEKDNTEKVRERMIKRHPKAIDEEDALKEKEEIQKVTSKALSKPLTLQKVDKKTSAKKADVVIHLSEKISSHFMKDKIAYMDTTKEIDGHTYKITFRAKNIGIPIVDSKTPVNHLSGIPIPKDHPLSTCFLKNETYEVKALNRHTYRIHFKNA
ncbi:hypothetical protein CN918_30615 [Priestia megaterium]|nr:hypothetical protein CN918_30615 [Priestia megaterium]